MKTFPMDADAVLDYKFDWTAWLQDGETITSRTVTVDAGITKDSDAITDSGKTVTVWLSAAGAGAMYRVACKIVTSSSRTDERTMRIEARQH